MDCINNVIRIRIANELQETNCVSSPVWRLQMLSNVLHTLLEYVTSHLIPLNDDSV